MALLLESLAVILAVILAMLIIFIITRSLIFSFQFIFLTLLNFKTPTKKDGTFRVTKVKCPLTRFSGSQNTVFRRHLSHIFYSSDTGILPHQMAHKLEYWEVLVFEF